MYVRTLRLFKNFSVGFQGHENTSHSVNALTKSNEIYFHCFFMMQVTKKITFRSISGHFNDGKYLSWYIHGEQKKSSVWFHSVYKIYI